MRIWNQAIPPESSWEKEFAGIDHLVLVNQYQSKSQSEITHDFFEQFFRFSPKGRIWIIDSVPWRLSRIRHWGYFEPETSAVCFLDSKLTAEHIPQGVQEVSLNELRSLSPEWEDLLRDLHRLARINVPGAFLVFDKLTEAELIELKLNLRAYDHVVRAPNGSTLVGLVNCPEDRTSLALARLNTLLSFDLVQKQIGQAYLGVHAQPGSRGLDKVHALFLRSIFVKRALPLGQKGVAA
jgi:hypothetical protein